LILIVKSENRQLYEVHITAFDFEKQCKASPEDLKCVLSLIRNNDIYIDNSINKRGDAE
jgi:hypothetical protein